jgi:hypothetical protein
MLTKQCIFREKVFQEAMFEQKKREHVGIERSHEEDGHLPYESEGLSPEQMCLFVMHGSSKSAVHSSS